MLKIGDRIKQIRKINNMTQAEFSKKINISQGTLSDIEKNKFNPSVKTILSIVNNFDISADWLLIGNKKDNDKYENKIVNLFMEKLSNIQKNEMNILNKTVKEIIQSKKILNNFFTLLPKKDQEEIVSLLVIKYIKSLSSNT